MRSEPFEKRKCSDWPINLGDSMPLKALSAGKFYTCAVSLNGTLKCFGDDAYGQLGLGLWQLHVNEERDYERDVAEQLVVATSGPVEKIVLSAFHACGVIAATTARPQHVQCWGRNDYGQVGDNTTVERHSPVSIDLPDGKTPSDVGVGAYHSCALSYAGDVFCWGHNTKGQLGTGNTDDHQTPNLVDLGGQAAILAAGKYHTCATMADTDTLKCWGYNAWGQVGNLARNASTDRNRHEPHPSYVNLGAPVKLLQLGGFHSCAYLITDELKCWGFNSYGQLGDGTNENRGSPVPIPINGTIESMSLGDMQTCVYLVGGEVQCWGSNTMGEQGYGWVTPLPTGKDVYDDHNWGLFVPTRKIDLSEEERGVRDMSLTAHSWVLSESGGNCTAACADKNLACSETSLAAHNEQATTNEGFDALLQSLGQTKCSMYSTSFGNIESSPAIMVGANGVVRCALSGVGRVSETFSCAAPTMAEARRLCVCTPTTGSPNSHHGGKDLGMMHEPDDGEAFRR